MNRKAAVENLKNGLWALGFAVGIWYFADQNVSRDAQVEVALVVQPASRDIAVTYIHPERNEPVEALRATVTLRAPQSVLNRVSEWRREALYRLKTDQRLNTDITIPVRDFEFPFPPEVSVYDPVPETIRIRLAELRQRRLGIDTDIDEATIPRGYEIERSVSPATIFASGPKEKMEPPPRLKTARIDVLEELLLRGWKPGDPRPPPEIDISPVRIESPDPAIVPDRAVSVRVRIALRPKRPAAQFSVRPVIEIPMREAFPYRLEPTNEFVQLTLSADQTLLEELAKPGVLEKKVRAIVRLRPKDLEDIRQNVGRAMPLPVEVWTAEEIRCLADKEIQINVDVRPWTPLPSPTPETP